MVNAQINLNLDAGISVENIGNTKFNPSLPPVLPNIPAPAGVQIYVIQSTSGTVTFYDVYFTEDDGHSVIDAFGFCNKEGDLTHWYQYWAI